MKTRTIIPTREEMKARLPYVTHSTKYLDFVIRDFKPKTMLIGVVNKKSKEEIGRIEWYAPWRQYCFMPYGMTVWNAQCLEDIQNFITGLMMKHVPRPQTVGVLAQNLEDFYQWSETKHPYDKKKKTYHGLKRIYTYGKTKYVGMTQNTHCVGMLINKIIETDRAKQNKHYNHLKMNARLCMKKRK